MLDHEINFKTNNNALYPYHSLCLRNNVCWDCNGGDDLWQRGICGWVGHLLRHGGNLPWNGLLYLFCFSGCGVCSIAVSSFYIDLN